MSATGRTVRTYCHAAGCNARILAAEAEMHIRPLCPWCMAKESREHTGPPPHPEDTRLGAHPEDTGPGPARGRP